MATLSLELLTHLAYLWVWGLVSLLCFCLLYMVRGEEHSISLVMSLALCELGVKVKGFMVNIPNHPRIHQTTVYD